MSKFLTRLARAQSRLETVLALLSAAIVAAMMFLTFADVALRYIFNSPIQGVYVLSQMMLISVIWLASAYVQQTKSNIRIDVLFQKLSRNTQVVIELVMIILSLILCAILTWKGGWEFWQSWTTKEYSIGLIELPLWPSRSLFLIGIGILCLRFATDICHDFVHLIKNSSH